MSSTKPIVIMGAGPAGLTAAWELTKGGFDVVVWEADPTYVGGISRTVEVDGFRFDIGGHRFFSKSEDVNKVWREIMPDDFIDCPRLSRIYYRRKFFNYPLEAMESFRKLGPFEAVRIVCSYFKARLMPMRPETSFRQWVTNRFGKRLFDMFFKSYTEKVWGISCDEISADWASQRIKGLDLWAAVTSAFSGKKAAPTAKTLIRNFFYPRFGPGQMWETATRKINAQGGKVLLDRKVMTIHWDETGVTHVTGVNHLGEMFQQEGSYFISSIPLQELMLALDPPPPPEVKAAAKALRYRDFLTVCLVVNRADVFPDTWIYIHDPTVKVGRVQNYKNWSAAMVPDPEADLARHGILLLRGRRYLDCDRARPGAAGHPRGGADRPGARGRGEGRLRRAHAQGLPDLRPGVPEARRDHPRLGLPVPQPAAGRPQRHAPLQ